MCNTYTYSAHVHFDYPTPTSPPPPFVHHKTLFVEWIKQNASCSRYSAARCFVFWLFPARFERVIKLNKQHRSAGKCSLLSK